MKPAEEREMFFSSVAARGADHRKIGFEVTDYGVIKRRLVGDETEDDEHWRLGHPILFPNILRVGHGLELRVPVDDTHTLHMVTNYRQYNSGEAVQTIVPFEERPLYDNNGLLVRLVISAMMRTNGISVADGGKTSVYLATSPDVEGVSGGYYARCALACSSPESLDESIAGRLWQVSAERIGIAA